MIIRWNSDYNWDGMMVLCCVGWNDGVMFGGMMV